METEKILAWHFYKKDGTTGEMGLPVVVGETMEARHKESGDIVVPGDVLICNRALHGSVRAIDALSFAPGCMVQRVELWGELQTQSDKVGARYRKCLASANVTKLLIEWACLCYEDVAWMLEDYPDAKQKSDAAIIAARAVIAVLGTPAARDAGDAARAAAWAAGDAAWAAAWAAGDAARAAGDAALDAWDAGDAGAAAWDAARAAGAAGAAAWDAARDAALDAWDAGDAALDAWDAGDAARDAAIKKYNDLLEKMLTDELGLTE